MKRASKTEKKIAVQRQDDIARQQRTAKRRGYTEARLNRTVLPAAAPEDRRDKPPGPLKKGADALDRDVHTLALENYERRRRGQPALSYGQARIRGLLDTPWEEPGGKARRKAAEGRAQAEQENK